MRPLTATELLQVWERSLNQTILEKTFNLLATACSAADTKDIGHLSIGERDARLLQLREWTFGSRLQNMIKCPQCNEVIEWQSDTNKLYLQPIPPDLSVRTFEMEKDSIHIRFRLPDSHDVLNAATNKEGNKTILQNCILEISSKNGTPDVRELTEEIWMTLNDRMAKEDPQANISISLDCPSCFYRWEAVFDIVSFFWAEINNWATRILQEVYLLARAFGWSEKDILNMSSRRRQLYIQMIGK